MLIGAFAWAQQPIEQRPNPATDEVENYSLEANNFIDALLKISAKFQLPLGVEWVKTTNTLKPVTFSWTHATLTAVMQAVVSMRAGYGWRVEDGIIHVFKRDLLVDRRNLLNITIESFDERPETVSWANNDLYQMVSQVLRHPEQHGIGGSVLGYPSEPVFRFAAKNVPARSILDKIVTAGLNRPEPMMNRIWIVTFPAKAVFSRNGFLEVAPIVNQKFVSGDGQPFWVLLPWGDPPMESMVR
jgi:hypothetical protein